VLVLSWPNTKIVCLWVRTLYQVVHLCTLPSTWMTWSISQQIQR
jgi:hypothetical protein